VTPFEFHQGMCISKLVPGCRVALFAMFSHFGRTPTCNCQTDYITFKTIWSSLSKSNFKDHYDEAAKNCLGMIAGINAFSISGPPSNTWFLGPTWVTPKMASQDSISSSVLHGSRVWPTDIHRVQPCYSFCRNRPQLCYACDDATGPKNKDRNPAVANWVL